MNFPCTGCGLCCQNISEIEELKEFDLGNGVCRYYNQLTKECSIYQDRPLVCRVDKMYSKNYSKEYSKEEFYQLNAKICNYLQDMAGLDLSYRVNLNN
jgi:Fe-S-cluster containining protein